MYAYEPLKKYLKIYGTAEGKQIFDECLKVTKAYFPQYVVELEAKAKGADVPFHYVRLLNQYKLNL